MDLKRSKTLASAGLLLLALSACTDSTTGPAREAFDPVTTSQDIQIVEDAFDTPIYNSMESLGRAFRIPGANLGSSAASLAASSVGTDANYGDVVRISEAIMNSFSSPQVILIPEQYRGLTLVYNPETEDYEVDESLEGAPDNGIRFILYAVNPLSKDIALPLTEIGHADLLDESTETAGTVRIIAISGDIEFMNYTVSLTGTALNPSVQILGRVSDGTTVVELDLTNSASINIGGATVSLVYDIAIPSRNFEISATLTIEVSVQTEQTTVTIDVRFTEGRDSVQIAGTIVNDVGTLEVLVNGDVFALVTQSGDGFSVTGADGSDLTLEQARALEEITDGLQEVFDTFDTFFEPVQFLFGEFGED